MKLVNVDSKYLLLILLISIVFVFDLFGNIGRSANGDGLIHTVVPTLFAKAIVEGNFPVGWVDGFANYGLPLGTISQQLTTYLTAFTIIFSHNSVLGFNIVVFLGVFLSGVCFYYFLRIYFSSFYAFIGIFLFVFTPYRILNVYIRGALPEFFAGVFFPLLLIASHMLIVKKNIGGLFLFVASFALLTLTHPFMDIVALFLVVPYILFLLLSMGRIHIFWKNVSVYSILFSIAISFAILLTSYYTLPLVFEIKYFYYGQGGNHLTPNNFLSLNNFFLCQYPYFTKLDILNRGFAVTVGGIETIIFISGIIYFLWRLVTRKILKTISLIDFAIISGTILIFMTTKASSLLYLRSTLLANIQFPWRMLSAFIFLPPIILSFFLEKINKKILTYIVVFLIAFFAFPQLYGKNYTVYPANFYSFTAYNLDAVVMNTIWTGDSTTYPITTKASIIEGQGKIISERVTNSSRTYLVSAANQIRMVDRTFYFPGWHVRIDENDTTIEYQNPQYRGVITYLVPAGEHRVDIIYEDTKIRLVGKILTIITLLGFIVLFLFRKFLQNLFVRYTK